MTFHRLISTTTQQRRKNPGDLGNWRVEVDSACWMVTGYHSDLPSAPFALLIVLTLINLIFDQAQETV